MLDHPLHPMFVHFTIALGITAVFTHLLGAIITHNEWKQRLIFCAAWMLSLCAVGTIVTLITGFLQFSSVSHDAGSHLAMVNHRNWAIATFIFLTVIAFWGAIRYRAKVLNGFLYPALLLVFLGFIGTTAYKGGRLVYDYGIGVKSTPELRKLQLENNANTHENIMDR